jgi:hypothetical protein
MSRGKKLSASERMEKLEESAAERKACFRELLKHIEDGFSIDCFGPLGEDSIKLFFDKYPMEFEKGELYDSIRKGKQGWEEIGKRQATGHCIGNSRSWYYNMANRYGWSERSKVEADVKGSVTVSIVNYNPGD